MKSFLRPPAIRQVTEDERARDGTGHVERADQPDLKGRRTQATTSRSVRPDRADDRHLEPVEDPDEAEGED